MYSPETFDFVYSYVFSSPRIDCMMLVLVTEFTPTNKL